MPRIDSPDLRLTRWLNQRGLRENPFASWNAEREPNLPDYFVDVGQFDELLHATEPCVVFAARGCGKTAQRKMLATQYLPLNRDGVRLAINCTVSDFERVLSEANGDVNQVRAMHHVNALLHSGLTTFMKEVALDATKPTGVPGSLEDRSWLAAYLARFAPHLQPAWPVETPAVLDMSNWLALLQGFAELVHHTGLADNVVLVDGLDELPVISDDPTTTVAFLTSLLGMLQLIECPGWTFKFFLPQELEQALRSQPWFRPDRLRLFRIAWNAQGLLDLIEQRLTYFSQRKPPLRSLAQLCDDELGQIIDHELATLAKGSPRVALILASTLLQRHCQHRNPSERIGWKTWDLVKAEWEVRREDFPGQEQLPLVGPQARSANTPTPAISGLPVLYLEDNGVVRLDEHDISSKIKPQDYRVLVCLYKYQGRFCSKDLLAQEAWIEIKESDVGEMDRQQKKELEGIMREGVSDQAIAASIARLRAALGQSTPDEGYIETIKGRGYRLHPAGFAAGK